MKKLNDLTPDALDGKTVFLRTEFNVALNDEFQVVDDSRIRASLPTIEWLTRSGARVVVCSHIGRPRGKYDRKKSLKHLVEPLSDLLKTPVSFAKNCIGPPRAKAQRALSRSGVLLLENVGFHMGEMENDPKFAASLASKIDIYVNDAFGNSHRSHASMASVPACVPQKVAGLSLVKELLAVNGFLEGTKHPAVAIVGGAKVAGEDGKIHVIRNIMPAMDSICIVGKIAYYFLKANGLSVGKTIDPDTRQIDAPESDVAQSVKDCAAVLEDPETKDTNILLPMDSIVASPRRVKVKPINHDIEVIPPKASALDVGQRTTNAIGKLLKKARSIVWNGPAGYFEDPRFREGTLAIARAIKNSNAQVLVGGGDTLAALKDVGFSPARVHVCTGGGAMLVMLMGRELPAVTALED
ncbi:MAG: phosphoglycerate kinase [Phycisphaerae bacterium]|nr:phosphoglycerate kinase [Phycisphaerae bacterium]